MTTVSIIGTAGRKGDGKLLTSSVFTAMIREAERIITETWKLSWDRVHLVSGAAAWAGM